MFMLRPLQRSVLARPKPGGHSQKCKRLAPARIPDEANARPYCLCKGVDAPDLVTVKDFLPFTSLRAVARLTRMKDLRLIRLTSLLSGSLPASPASWRTDEADMSNVYNASTFPEGRGRLKLIITSGSGKHSLQRVWW
jgi:hypothetical protein